MLVVFVCVCVEVAASELLLSACCVCLCVCVEVAASELLVSACCVCLCVCGSSC